MADRFAMEERERLKREFRELIQRVKWLNITGEEHDRRIREWFHNRRRVLSP